MTIMGMRNQQKSTKGENMKIKKSLLLSLSLMLSLSRAEDDGFYMSVGYQIGEAGPKSEEHWSIAKPCRQIR